MRSYFNMVIIIVFAILLTIVINISILFNLNNSIDELKNYFTNQIVFEESKKEVIYETNEQEEVNPETIMDEIEEHEKTKIQDEKTEQIAIEEQNKSIEEQNTINEGNIVGNIKIPKINFEGKIYEGTTLDVLKNGVGHFDNSPYLDGNVCLAAHNTSKFWANLKTLNKGDLIYYDCFLGTREYTVSEVVQIDETDWSKLENTDENILTLLTCVKGNKPKRLCVIAKET